MLILGIETSCDETAVAVVECSEGPSYRVLSSVTSSQIAKHIPFGGVVPNIANREHELNLVPVLTQALKEANLPLSEVEPRIFPTELQKLLRREQHLHEVLVEHFLESRTPNIDALAVTQGPGLEPALWVGLNLGKALSLAWSKPLIPVNHMEGHIVAALLDNDEKKVDFPAIALLVSGGHTELVLMHAWKQYELLGQTRDDAAGEAFDKVARLLGLPYPGGPEITKAATDGKIDERITLPRPMLHDKTLDFSYSGLKTAVLYLVRKLGTKGVGFSYVLDPQTIANVALEFEKAATEVLIAKTLKAFEKTGAHTLIVGGGVAANKRLRNDLTQAMADKYPSVTLLLPDPKATGDNAAMIAGAAYLHVGDKEVNPATLTADGNLRLA